ncbi:chorismate mutase [Corynebacterium sp. HMSC11E11]|uniref:chorismate mutase n=1 Tax=Corynebacterium sp. HMSC11E11 TaxID=1581089 RepID=UPI0008BAED14|nr:chorismate mutase [Corynebacterium sp. HMSC11E11]OFU55031.1 hypothetical protein HMPREF3121_06750 [Corynebacterium sp. HMSC11E11]
MSHADHTRHGFDLERAMASAKADWEAGATLGTLRRNIDELDEEIVALLARRQHWVTLAAFVKRESGEEAVRAPERVDEVLGKVKALADENGLSHDIAEPTYRALIAASIDHQLGAHRLLRARSAAPRVTAGR